MQYVFLIDSKVILCLLAQKYLNHPKYTLSFKSYIEKILSNYYLKMNFFHTKLAIFFTVSFRRNKKALYFINFF